ncbi:histidine kinase [Vibrio ichthyoenteri ATCC 700023]|uniref:histidine kinase n=1 Tax=Vibrio ichthyoenteri ATCC 700023 TaxID=870968 RepID=F9S8T0_9VIBR|nr:hybrid sensor histidine kinase/response regulator [Vibrio ichthyoenteri]EGU29567.1 histidine kinase [Vibrio ichthyoenteri ATCC 700023]
MKTSFLKRLLLKRKYKQSFFNKSNCALLLCKNDRHSTIIEANDTFYQLVGYNKEEFANEFNSQFAALVIDDLSQILGKVSKSLQDSSTLDYEFRIRHKQGHTLWIHDIATYDQQLDCFLVVIMDITYRQNALDSIVKATSIDSLTRWLSALIDNIPNPIAIYNNDEIIFSNKNFQRLKNNVYQLNATSDQAFEQSIRAIGHECATVSNGDEMIKTLGGRTYRIKQKPIEHPFDKTIFSMLTFDDITTIKEKKVALTKAIKARNHFLAVVSHELRTPIAAMLGLMRLLEKHLESDESKELLASSVQSAQRLNLHVNDILDFSKIEANQIELDIHPTNLLIELSSTLRSFDNLCQAKKIEFTLDWQPTPFNMTDLDWLRTEQICNNILSNALKFTEQGKIHAHIDLGQNRLDIQLIDSGCGMSEEQLSLLYTPFQQGDKTISRRYGGTGLGLSIVKQLVELMGGSIHITSQSDIGTKVTISIPCESHHSLDEESSVWLEAWQNEVNQKLTNPNDYHANIYPDQIIKRVKTLSSSPSKSSRCNTQRLLSDVHVLLVDDDPINRLLFKKQLNTLGVLSTVLESPAQVIELLLERNNSNQIPVIDIVITDIHMPEMNGYELAKRLRRSREFQHIPIVGCTADNSKEVIAKAQSAQMNDVIFKPYSMEILHSIIKEHC